MTIHAAKGLEFPVVCVPDLSRSTPAETGAVAVGPRRRGRAAPARRPRQGARAAPSTRASRPPAGRPRRPRATASPTSPGRARATASCSAAGWAAGAAASSSACSASSASSAPPLEPGVSDVDVAGTQVRVHVHTADARRAAGRAPARRPRSRSRRPRASSASSTIAPVVGRPPSTCSRRRSSRCRRPRCTCRARSPTARSPCTIAAASPTTPSAWSGLRSPRAADGPLRGALLGDALHRAVAVGVERACAELEPRTIAPPWRPSSRPGRRSSLAARMRAAGSVEHELPFAFCEDDVVLRGSLDICVRERRRQPARGRPQDDRPGGREPAAVVESEYALQRAIYALAALRSGAPACRDRVLLPRAPGGAGQPRATRQTDADGLAAEVRAAIARLRASRFTARAGRPLRDLPGARPPLPGAGLARAGAGMSRLDASSPPESRVRAILRRLRVAYPDARCSLDFTTPWELLVATILSAQCTDERVNMVTPGLFRALSRPAGVRRRRARARSRRRSSRRASTTRRRARCAARRWPCSSATTARCRAAPSSSCSCRAWAARPQPSSAATPSGGARASPSTRTSAASRAGSASRPRPIPRSVERDLMAIVPRSAWVEWSHLLIWHGRAVCISRAPRCPECVLLDLCPEGQVRVGRPRTLPAHLRDSLGARRRP